MNPDSPVQSEAQFLAEVLETEGAALGRIARRVLQDADDGTTGAWSAALDRLEACTGHVIVSGMGKSGLIGAKISATLSSLGQPSSFVHPSEAVHGDLGRVKRGDVAILLSASGQTEEVVNLAAILRADRVPRIGISCNGASALARLCDVHLDLGDIAEACPLNLAPTTSTTAQLAVGDALALALARRRNFDADDFHRSHPGGMLGAGLRRITDVLRVRAGRELPVVSDAATVREALLAARPTPGARRAGALLLADAKGRLSGILTDADLRRLLVGTDDANAVLDRPVRAVMTARPRHLGTEDLVRDAVRLVREHRVDEIPIVDADGRPVGLMDIQDLVALKVVQD